jgi:hypothetical protein
MTLRHKRDSWPDASGRIIVCVNSENKAHIRVIRLKWNMWFKKRIVLTDVSSIPCVRIVISLSASLFGYSEFNAFKFSQSAPA